MNPSLNDNERYRWWTGQCIEKIPNICLLTNFLHLCEEEEEEEDFIMIDQFFLEIQLYHVIPKFNSRCLMTFLTEMETIWWKVTEIS